VVLGNVLLGGLLVWLPGQFMAAPNPWRARLAHDALWTLFLAACRHHQIYVYSFCRSTVLLGQASLVVEFGEASTATRNRGDALVKGESHEDLSIRGCAAGEVYWRRRRPRRRTARRRPAKADIDDISPHQCQHFCGPASPSAAPSSGAIVEIAHEPPRRGHRVSLYSVGDTTDTRK